MKLKSSVLLLGASIFIASCTNKSIPTNGESDDMYATSADAAQAPIVASTNTPFNKNNGVNTQQLPYEDEYDRLDNGDVLESTDEYYSEDYITTRDYKRKISSKPGYSDGYSDGYSQGWTDYSWSQPIAMGWNSPFNRIGYNSFSPFNSGIYMSYGFGGGWGMNSWNRFSPWGYNSWGNSWMMDSWAYSPWGYNSWGYNSFYSPWGYNSFYSPYDYYGGGYYNNYRPYYNNQSVVAQNAYRNGSRTFGAREAGRNSSNYNDRFVNTSKPSANASGGRSSSSVRNSNSANPSTNGERVLADRKNGTWVGNNSSNNANNSSNRTTYSNSRASNSPTDSYNPSTRRPASYDSYNRSANSGSSNYSSRSASTNNAAQGNTYTRPSSSRSSGNNTYSSPSYDRGSSNYSTPSRSSSSSSSSSSSNSSSSGSSSRGSSGGSSSGGSSRGPR